MPAILRWNDSLCLRLHISLERINDISKYHLLNIRFPNVLYNRASFNLQLILNTYQQALMDLRVRAVW